MSDDKILKSLQIILDTIYDKDNGIFLNENLEQREERKKELSSVRNVNIVDVRFDISGKDIYEQKLGDIVSCTGMTKVVLYIAKKLGLDIDLKAVITTEIACLMQGKSNNGHVVPAVKMSDGKYHIFEPRRKYVSDEDFQKMLNQDVAIGKSVYHVLKNIKDNPYEIVDIIDQDELESIKTMNEIIVKSRRK